MYASYACARLEALSLLIPLQRSLGVTQCEVRGPEIEIPGVVHGEDVRMREPGGELDLTQEPLGADLRGDLRAQRLHRDVAVVLDVVREEDDRHSPLSQLALDLVSAVETVGQAFLECTHAVNITRETLGCEFGVLVSLECRRVRRAGPAARTADPFGWDRAADAHAAGSTPTPSPRRRCPATGTRRQCDPIGAALATHSHGSFCGAGSAATGARRMPMPCRAAAASSPRRTSSVAFRWP